MTILEKARSKQMRLPTEYVPSSDEIEAVIAYLKGDVTMAQLEYGFDIPPAAGPSKVRVVLCQGVRHGLISVVVKKK